MGALVWREVRSYLNSLIAYIVIGIFLMGIGLLFWVFPETSVMNYGYADMGTFFSLCPFVFMFLIPAITMRSFAEEKKAGTMEFLLTKPVTDLQIIMGKYLAACLVIALAILPTILYYISLYFLGSPQGNIDTAGVLGSYLGLFLLAFSFTAIGIFASALSENQIVSFIIGVFILFILYSGLQSLANLDTWGTFTYMLSQWAMQNHYDALGKGLIDSRDVVYFISIIAIALVSTRLTLTTRTW